MELKWAWLCTPSWGKNTDVPLIAWNCRTAEALQPQWSWRLWRGDWRTRVCWHQAILLSSKLNFQSWQPTERESLRFSFQSTQMGEIIQSPFDSLAYEPQHQYRLCWNFTFTCPTGFTVCATTFYPALSLSQAQHSSLMLGKGTGNGWWEIFSDFVCFCMCVRAGVLCKWVGGSFRRESIEELSPAW